jgi:hypothetical protein
VAQGALQIDRPADGRTLTLTYRPPVEGLPRAGVDLAQTYQHFADREVAHYSPSYAEICRGIAADRPVLDLIAALPLDKRQPNLLLAAVRWLGGPVSSYAAFRAYVLAQWTDVAAVVLVRRTQTNEVGRCATLMPVLAALPGPLALIEVGASAGLNLYPDRYQYRYGDRPAVGPHSSVCLTVETAGPVPAIAALPTVVWRAGIDLNPLDVADADDMRWLESLVWPEQADRAARLRAAIAIARTDPALLVRGDLNDRIGELAAQAPAGATVVVFHTAVLAYVDQAGRDSFAALMASLPVRWISNETPLTFPGIAASAPPPPMERELTLLALDGVPLAYATPHGQHLSWFAASPDRAGG